MFGYLIGAIGLFGSIVSKLAFLCIDKNLKKD